MVREQSIQLCQRRLSYAALKAIVNFLCSYACTKLRIEKGIVVVNCCCTLAWLVSRLNRQHSAVPRH